MNDKAIVPIELLRQLQGLCMEVRQQSSPRMVALAIPLYDALSTLLDAPAVEPVYWEWRWFDENPYTETLVQWSEWKRVEPRNALCTVEDLINEFKKYTGSGLAYQFRALYAAS